MEQDEPFEMGALQYGHQFEDVLSIRTAIFRDEPADQGDRFHVPPPNIFDEDKHLTELFEALRKAAERREGSPEKSSHEQQALNSAKATIASSVQMGRFAQTTCAAEERRRATMQQMEDAAADQNKFYGGPTPHSPRPTSRCSSWPSSRSSSRPNSARLSRQWYAGADAASECPDCPVCIDLGGPRAFVSQHLTRQIVTSAPKQVASTQSIQHKSGHHCPYHVELTQAPEVAQQFSAPADHRLTLPLQDWLTGGKNGSAAYGDCGLFVVSVPLPRDDPMGFLPPQSMGPLPADMYILGSVPIISRTLYSTIFCELGFAEVCEKFVFGYAEDLRSLGVGKQVRFKYTLPPNAMLSGMKGVIGSGPYKRTMELAPRPATEPGNRQASWKGSSSVRRRHAQQAAHEGAAKRRASDSRIADEAAALLPEELRPPHHSKSGVRPGTAVRFGSVSFAGNPTTQPLPSQSSMGGLSPRFIPSAASNPGLRPSLMGAACAARHASTGGRSGASSSGCGIRYMPEGAVGDGPNTLSVDLGAMAEDAVCSVEVRYMSLLENFDSSFKFSHLATWVPPNDGHCLDLDSYPMHYHIHMVAQPDSVQFVDLGAWSGGLMGVDMLPCAQKQPDGTVWWLMQRSIRVSRQVEATHIIVDMKRSGHTKVMQLMTQRAPERDGDAGEVSRHGGQEPRVAFIKAQVMLLEDECIQDSMSSCPGRDLLQHPGQPLLDIWLLMDVSGSMAGQKMEACRTLAQNFVRGIPINRGIKFNMVAYRDSCECWSSGGSTLFSPMIREDALRSINDVVAGGKASLSKCLKGLYAGSELYGIPKGYQRRVFLLTDGVTSDVEAREVYDIVRNRSSPTAMMTSLFCVGIGMLGGGELSQKLLRKSSQKTGGMMVIVEPGHDIWSRCRLIMKAVLSKALTLAPSLQLPSGQRYSQPTIQLPGLVRPGQNISMLVKVYESIPGDMLTLRLTERPGKSVKLLVPMAPSTAGAFPLTFRRTAWDAYDGGTQTGYGDGSGRDGAASMPVGRIRTGTSFSQLYAMICLTSMLQDLSSVGAKDEETMQESLYLRVEAAEQLAASYCLMTPMSQMVIDVKLPGLNSQSTGSTYLDILDAQNPYPYILPFHVQRLPATRMTAGDPMEDAPEFGRLPRAVSEGIIAMLRKAQRKRGAWLAHPDMHMADSGSVLFHLVDAFTEVRANQPSYHHNSHVGTVVLSLMKYRPVSVLSEDQWVTVLVLAFLTKHLMQMRDAWELMEATAWVWLGLDWPPFPEAPLYRAGDKGSSCRTLAITQAARATATIGHSVLEAHHLIP